MNGPVAFGFASVLLPPPLLGMVTGVDAVGTAVAGAVAVGAAVFSALDAFLPEGLLV